MKVIPRDFPTFRPRPCRPARIAVVLGTRPEAIKLAPVIREMGRCDDLDCKVVSTGQHREMLDQVLGQFDITPDVELGLMTCGQGLNDLTRRVLEAMDSYFDEARPDLCLVQGDTTTAFAASLAAFYRQVPVGHVEAGLRSGDLSHPFPEEANRRLTSVVTEIHFAPTALARQRLLEEGHPAERIVVTGNPVVDALAQILEKPFHPWGTPLAALPREGRTVLITSHRRESWGKDLENICLAVRDLAERFPDVRFVYPVHLNPRVRETVETVLAGLDRVHLLEPLGYLDFIHLMKRCSLILTDSGGVQEEAPTLGKPLLLLRKVTERPEAFLSGAAKIVGAGREAIVAAASRLLTDENAYRAMVSVENPYGDGCAAQRIVETLVRWHFGERPWLSAERQFLVRAKEMTA